MFIKSITIDGFKSYRSRVELTAFDPAFNAITGLNDTGKSNILDAIVFVLGIRNLSIVRADTLTELIYKEGRAGITKATVTITFDNRDKSQVPYGYESADEITVTREIDMGGGNTYMINGIIVQSVSDLFRSVQLNVNNPHFLIMQGGISKMLALRPRKIMSMIEEAAGTSLYETKKRAALNTIAQKDGQIAQLEKMITEDIEPMMQQLQDQARIRPSIKERQYAELMREMRIVKAELRVMQETIRAVDEKKRSTLLEAVARIDQNLGVIYSKMVPGGNASLVPPPGFDVLEGLQLRIFSHGLWTTSLEELSGGERVQVALALLLAMMRYKLAPLYILDAVDVTLDGWNTQNIGLMLRNHFPNTQLIVVSQKKEMFSQANVLFRTSMEHGQSEVQRTDYTAAHASARALPEP